MTVKVGKRERYVNTYTHKHTHTNERGRGRTEKKIKNERKVRKGNAKAQTKCRSTRRGKRLTARGRKTERKRTIKYKQNGKDVGERQGS